MEIKNTHITYGLITGLIIAVLGLILHLTDMSMQPWAPYISLVPFLVGILLNAFAFSKANDHYVSFGKVFSSCFKASAIVTLIMVVWTIIFMNVFPEIKEQSLEKAMEEMSKNDQLSQEQMDQAVEMTRKMFVPFAIGGALFMYMFMGAVFSLLGAAVAKKHPAGTPPPSIQS